MTKTTPKQRKSRDNLCKYFDTTKEELDKIVVQLSIEQQTFLKELYTEDYQRKESLSKKQSDHLSQILRRLDQLSNGEKTIKSRDDLCKYLDKTKEEMKQIVSQLSSEDMKSLQEFYDKNYKRIISKEITPQQKNHLFYQLNCIIQGKLVKTKNTPQPSKKEKSVVEKDLTEEEIQKLLKILNQNTIEKQAKKLPIEDSIIFILRNEIYESKEFSIETISEFLQEDPQVIKKIEKRALMTFKQQLTSLDSELEESERQKIFSLKG